VITIMLEPYAERQALSGAVPGYQGPLLDHQARTYTALASGAPLVMNTYPTGTGKTLAALLWLLHPAQQGRNALIIAPTNALVNQQADDARRFVAEQGLDMDVIAFDANRLKALAPEIDGATMRTGEVAQRLLTNPTTFWQELGLPPDAPRRPFVAITNPDIFYYAIYFQYGHNDQRNLFDRMFTRFHYLVIDEFHYYDAKQFANFLFFFGLWQHWGYSAAGYRLCLLSATPRNNVLAYLTKIFGDRWMQVNPQNAPPESLALPPVAALSPLKLTLVAGHLDSWVLEQGALFAQWMAEGLDTVVISSSLARINIIAHALAQFDPVRITGPEPQQERQRVAQLTLATPTVDLGYNFGRSDKSRQSIDRLVCDARFGDELTQRIGRAGRVLGREQSDLPSEAFVVLSDGALAELQQYAGQTLDRQTWAGIVNGLNQLPPKHQLDGYIRSYGLVESFYPIYKLQSIASQGEDLITDLFPMVKELFAPNSRQSVGLLQACCRSYDTRRQWLRKAEGVRWATAGRDGDDTARQVADYLGWRQSRKGVQVRYDANKPDIRAMVPRIAKFPEQRQAVEQFVQMQVELMQAQFSFRDAWQGPVGAIFDPQRVFSSEAVNRYDVLHLYANYDLQLYPNEAAFVREHGPVAAAVVYGEILGLRSERLSLGLSYQSQWSVAEFEERCCRAVTALYDLQLTARTSGPGGMPQLLPPQIAAALAKRWVVCLVVAEASTSALISVLANSPFFARELLVRFPDGSERSYSMVLGTAAFHILPALNGHYRMRDRQIDDAAIWC
jgi:CRISPR-associated endonuclease/helicase Cas3